MKKKEPFFANTKPLIFLCCLIFLLDSCNVLEDVTLNADAALYGGGLTRHTQAVTESWNGYFIDIGSPDRVSNLDRVLVFGPHLGVTAEVPIAGRPIQNNTKSDRHSESSKGWYFAPGIHYTQKGGKLKGNYGSNGSKTPFSSSEMYHYINFDLPFRYRIVDNFYVEAGPQLGYMVSKNSIEIDNGAKSEDKTTKGIKRFEFAVSGGGGYCFGNSGLGMFIKMFYGLTKIDDSEPSYTKVRNFGAMLGVYYSFIRPGKSKKN